MALYSTDGDKLSEVKSLDFKLEKDLQAQVEQNTEELLGLQFIASEFELHALRIDSLAYDRERNAFVVIEYKRDKSTSVVDQGYAYLALVLNNKADFVLEYNERTGKNTNKNSFDWSQTRVIFVANRFTPYQLGAISFRDLPIELWQAKNYENGFFGFEQQVAEKTAESIKTIAKQRPTTAAEGNVATEIKTYEVSDLIKPQWAKTRELFEVLDAKVTAVDADVHLVATRSNASYRLGSDWRNIITLNFSKQGIVVNFTRTQPADLQDPAAKLNYDEKSMQHYNQHISKLRIETAADVDYAFFLFDQAFKRHIERFGKD